MIFFDIVLNGLEVLRSGLDKDHADGFARAWREMFPDDLVELRPVKYGREAA